MVFIKEKQVSSNVRILKGSFINNMTNEEFFLFCQENPQINLERDNKKRLLIMPPTGSNTGKLNSEINCEITLWNRSNKTGQTFDSSTGFTLPDGSVKSPDASWVSNKKWDALTNEQKKRFAPVCPEFIVELRSENDLLSDLQNKMKEWIDNGVLLAFLIDPNSKKSYIYKPNKDLQIVDGFDKKLSGENILEGFELDLSLLEETKTK